MIDLLPAWLHDLDPFALRLGGDIGLRWYGLSYLAGFAAGLVLLKFLARRGAVRIASERAIDVIITLAIAAMVGGRLGYVLFYQPSLLWTFESSLPFWSVLALNQGGMASHGGMIGVAIAAWLVARGPKDEQGNRPSRIGPLEATDAIAMVAPAGLMFGRLANFINGELLGKVVAAPGQDAPWWAVRFPQEHLGDHAPQLEPQQEVQLVRLVSEVDPAAASFAEGYETVLARLQAGSVEVAQRLEPLVSARHPSQLYQAAAEGLAVGLVCWFVARKPRTPGAVSAAFLMTYGILRIVTELYRLPDAHLTVQQFLGLSRGQWLSTAMVLIGVGILVWTKRVSTAQPHLGWASRGRPDQPAA